MGVGTTIGSKWVRVLLISLTVALGLIVGCVGLLFIASMSGTCIGGIGPSLSEARTGFTPKWTPDSTYIVFTVNDINTEDPQGRIYIAASDGSSLRLITEGDLERANDHSPDVSPDGSLITYSTYRYLHREPRKLRDSFAIVTSDIQGGTQRSITENTGFDYAPEWSPDSSRIAFVRYDSYDCGLFNRKGIYTMNADGSDVRRIVSFRTRNWDKGRDIDDYLGGYGSSSSYLAWSPDSQFLAYVIREDEHIRDQTRYRGTRNRSLLYTVRTDGSDQRAHLVQNGRASIGSPVWSSDGRYIRFMKSTDGGWSLYSIARDGGILHEMVDTGTSTERLPDAYYSGDLSWSPNDSQILFHLAHEGRATPTLYLVNADGSDLRFLGNGFHGAWSPDGSSIAIVVPAGSGTWSCLGVLVCTDVALYTMAADGSNVRVLARRTDDGALKAVGPELRPSADVASCSRGVVVPNPDMNHSLVRDCEALVGMIDRIAVVGLNWDADTPISEWEGVTLEVPGQGNSATSGAHSPLRVRGLSLPERGLIGEFPLTVTELTELRSLDFSDNEHRGELDNLLWGNLANLQVLDISFNDLSGPIPSELGELTNLRELNLSDNHLSGPIPSELGELTNLQELNISSNSLSGPIPLGLGNLPNLKYLNLGYTAISGCIPPGLRGKVRGYTEPDQCNQ